MKMVRRIVPVVTGLMLVSGAAAAQGRPSTTQMTCDQARDLVAARGGVVLNTSPTTYDRYVLDGRFCLQGQYTRPEWVPTRDTPQCAIGYTCTDRSPFFFDDD